jgi:hypothetical protein
MLLPLLLFAYLIRQIQYTAVTAIAPMFQALSRSQTLFGRISWDKSVIVIKFYYKRNLMCIFS